MKKHEHWNLLNEDNSVNHKQVDKLLDEHKKYIDSVIWMIENFVVYEAVLYKKRLFDQQYASGFKKMHYEAL